ncbi:hypothetical protein AGMMS49944_10950 [Spirochaetia bacterium]|nr:hypothetical protein AGMMS49944_10950 [Spirochaetia bacterium]
MTLRQTIDIPASHRLILDVPGEVPVGKATLTYRPEIGLFSRIRAFLHAHSPFRSAFSRHFDEFYGCLKGTGIFEGDAADIVKEWHDEWEDPWERSAELARREKSNGED